VLLTYHIANKASRVVNGTAADEPSAHSTRFNRKKIPNINLQSQNKKITLILVQYLTIIRQRRSEYCGIIPEMKLRGLFHIIC